MIFFVDDVADHLQIFNSAVVVLEKDQGIMDVAHWLEEGWFNLKKFDIIVYMSTSI